MTDLDKLIAAVEAGATIAWGLGGSPSRKSLPMHWHDAMNAYLGSIDAALRLHEALLPGWGVASMCQLWDVTPAGEYVGIGEEWNVDLHQSTGDVRSGEASGTAKGPARAWLLAILRALKAKGDA